ncbi:MAG TPA: hypothetical protein VGB85_01290 [Nannocystis sp.]
MISLDLPRSTRWSLLAAGLMLPLAVAMMIRLAQTPAPKHTPVRSVPAFPALCDATRLDGRCADDQHCVADICHPLRRGARGTEGTLCRGDLCDAGLECFHGRCVSWDRLPRAPEVCRAGPTRASLEYLRSRCAADLGQVDAPLTACTAKTWEPLSRRDPTFAGHIEALTHVFTVHFPQGEPGPRGTWATPEIRATYLRQLAPHHAALRDAKALLVIGRASVEGSEELNRALSERRTALVVGLLRSALGDAAPPIHAWALADQDALPPEQFMRVMKTAVLAWDEAITRRLLTQTDLAERSGPDWQWFLEVVNRAVLIVPLYCDGREYYPQPSFQGAADPHRSAQPRELP